MSPLKLRDWAVRQKILASDLQGHTDVLRAVYPLTFSGNVLAIGGAQAGMHVHVLGERSLITGMPLLHITSAATGNGQYIAREVVLPDTWDSTAPLDLSTLDDGDDDVLFINGQENNSGTHWLTHADNTDQVYLTPDSRWPIADEEGRTIYYSNNAWFKPCPTPTPSPTPPP